MSTHQSDLSTLKESDFSINVKQACGLILQDPIFQRTSNISQLLAHRERGLYKSVVFTSAMKCKITNNLLPRHSKIIFRSPKGIYCSKFSPDGKIFLIAKQNGLIHLFNSHNDSYKPYQTVVTNIGSCADMTVSPDNSSVVYSSDFPHIWMFNLNDRNSAFIENHQRIVLRENGCICCHSVVHSSDGKELLCGSNDGYIFIVDKERQICKKSFSAHVKSETSRVIYMDNSSQIFCSGGNDRVVKIWDIRTINENHFRPIGIMDGHLNQIIDIDPKGDGRYLISNSFDNTIKLWDIRKLSNTDSTSLYIKYSINGWRRVKDDVSVMTYVGGHQTNDRVIRAKFSPLETTGQRYIYTGCSFGRIVVYDALTGSVVRCRKAHKKCVNNVSWHPIRNEILSTSMDGKVFKWTHEQLKN